MPSYFSARRLLLAIPLGALCATAAARQPAGPLADYSLEQLSQIIVTSVGRQEASLASVPVSITRVTRQQIRRSGATTLPEALRLASNLLVVRTSASDYAITARGFASTVENKMLVMIDGRVVYSPLFSGVFWDVQDVLLEDVERIEVISGPGSTIWGANAVNGVINVITRSAAESQGVFVAAGAGNTERRGAARLGAALPGGGHYRIYAKHGKHDDLVNEAGQPVPGRWRRTQAGFRTDFSAGNYAVTLSGDTYAGRNAEVNAGDTELTGSNLNASASRTLDDGSRLRLQAWLDYASRAQQGASTQRMHTADLEAQHDVSIGRHHVAWGGGYRQARDRVRNGGPLHFLPAAATLRWANVFVQDRILLSPDLQLTLGTRFEKSSYSRVEWLPTARLAYHTGPSDLLWVGATRTVRAPSRADRDLYVVSARPTPGAPYAVEGNDTFRSEIARVMELGYRAQAGGLAYSIVAYRTRYDDLRALEPRPGLPAVFANSGLGKTRGLEFLMRWRVTPRWQLSGGGVVQRVATWIKPGSLASPRLTGVTGNDPDHYWRLHSAHELGRGIELDLELRGIARLPEPHVPSYHELDVRLAWNAAPGLEASVTGRNLLHSEHPEFGPAATRQLVGRSVLFNLSWRY
ncbi:TonB-dependent receptor plug domain-containing protein [Pseudoduganella sp. GCM10020061]|uniref:TonB-dependent receptor plug domain-containing protein n=1 Tax=Pseudoduganella sp. GCM10020061 TaxID=3317345 RepID=UPI00362D385D